MGHSHAGHDHVWADDLTRNQELVLGTLRIRRRRCRPTIFSTGCATMDCGRRCRSIARSTNSPNAGWRTGSNRSTPSCAAPMRIVTVRAAARPLRSATRAARLRNSPSRRSTARSRRGARLRASCRRVRQSRCGAAAGNAARANPPSSPQPALQGRGPAGSAPRSGSALPGGRPETRGSRDAAGARPVPCARDRGQ